MTEVMIIISGSVDLTFKTSLVETVLFDSLFPGSTYATWALFGEGDAEERKSKFNVIGKTEGQYFSLAFSCLLRIAAVNNEIHEVIVNNKISLFLRGFPLCDFVKYRGKMPR